MGYRVEMLIRALEGGEEEYFYCPVEGCSYKVKSLAALKKHFRRFHADLKYYCPICKVKVRTVHHCVYYAYLDDKHLVLYYLVRNSAGCNNKTELVKKARELAYERLRDRNFKF